MKSGIYQIVNKLNGKIYVGSAINLNNRFSSHVSKLFKNKHVNVYLQRAWNKYGKEAFEFLILEYVDDKAKLTTKEQNWIDWLKSSDPDYGYNIRKIANSNLGLKYPASVGEKVRKANLGKIHSVERRLKNSEANKGHIVTKETKSKIGAANSKPDKWPHKSFCNCRNCLDKKNLERRLKRYNREGEFANG